MADYYALTNKPLPAELVGYDGEYSIRPISETDSLAIEDYFFRKGTPINISRQATVISVPCGGESNSNMEEFAVLAECALGVLTVTGFVPLQTVAQFNGTSCTGALQRPCRSLQAGPSFPRGIEGRAASKWLRHFFEARTKTHGLHITADRFVRYLQAIGSRDALVDLCICLESLLEPDTEISFRFSTCLAKVCNLEDRAEVRDILSNLYTLRSRVVHGTDSTKAHRKVEPNSTRLRLIARSILISYVLYMTNHSKVDWQEHLRNSLLA
jgi:hypothetical protein